MNFKRHSEVNMDRPFWFSVLAFGFSIFFAGCSNTETSNIVSSETIDALQIASFPTQIDNNCRDGKAEIFDECSEQTELFARASIRAKAEGKIVLVSYGAEWCIWCHVFDAYINGDMTRFTYTYGEAGNDERYTHTMREREKRDVSQEAYELKKFVSENFVVAHIDYEHSPDGDDVLSNAEAWEHYEGWVPYIFVVDSLGKYAAKFNHDEAEVRRDTLDWYRGYDRVLLLQQLKNMHGIATASSGRLE